MQLKEEFISYFDKEYELEAYVATKEKGKRPAVIIFHAFSGRDEFSSQIARKIATLGYVGFAADIYGKGVIGKTREESSKLMHPFIENRQLLQSRVLAAFNAVASLDYVDSTSMVSMGYCFGGLCSLDLARSGVALKGAVSFHGALIDLPPHMAKKTIKAKILVCHGYDDPQVSMEKVAVFQRSMNEDHVDWQTHIYGGVMHAFTNPAANDKDFGTVYNKEADNRSFKALENFLEELF